MHFNSGYQDDCIPFVERFVDAFDDYEAVVTPSASCASMVRRYHPVVAELAVGRARSGLPGRVATVSPRVLELTEFLVDVLGVTDVGAAFPHTVALHPTCHSTRLLGIGDRPQRLLAAVDGLTLVPLPHADQCCGFGGTFAVKNADTSVAMGIDKAADVDRQRRRRPDRRRHVLPDAHRRPAARASDRRPGHAPGRDPRPGTEA